MVADESFYEHVAQELRKGEVRQGLWAKSLASTEYDQQRAKALYIRLRAEAIKQELAEAARASRQQVTAFKRALDAHRKDERLAELDSAKAALAPLVRHRTSLRRWGFWGGFCMSALGLLTLFWTWRSTEGSGGWSFDDLLFGGLFVSGAALLGGFLGYVLAELLRHMMPGQWKLERSELRISQERDRLNVGLWMRTLRAAAIGTVFIAWLVYLVLKHFGDVS